MKLFVVVMDLSGGPCFSRPLLLHIHDKMAALIGFHECKKERKKEGDKERRGRRRERVKKRNLGGGTVKEIQEKLYGRMEKNIKIYNTLYLCVEFSKNKIKYIKKKDLLHIET